MNKRKNEFELNKINFELHFEPNCYATGQQAKVIKIIK